jgi:TetR/AcrR family transcriptional regulator
MRARGEATRRAILRAAERVFGERGYVGARMDEVAAVVGIKRASMVYYFRDKRSLYRALLVDLFGGLHQHYREVLDGPGGVRDRLLGCIDVWVSQVFERPGMMRVLVWETARSGQAAGTPLAAELAPVLATVAEAVAAGQREGAFRLVDPMRLMMVVAGATAFLTLGMSTFAETPAPMDRAELRQELRALVERVLFAD